MPDNSKRTQMWISGNCLHSLMRHRCLMEDPHFGNQSLISDQNCLSKQFVCSWLLTFYPGHWERVLGGWRWSERRFKGWLACKVKLRICMRKIVKWSKAYVNRPKHVCHCSLSVISGLRHLATMRLGMHNNAGAEPIWPWGTPSLFP